MAYTPPRSQICLRSGIQTTETSLKVQTCSQDYRSVPLAYTEFAWSIESHDPQPCDREHPETSLMAQSITDSAPSFLWVGLGIAEVTSPGRRTELGLRPYPPASSPRKASGRLEVGHEAVPTAMTSNTLKAPTSLPARRTLVASGQSHPVPTPI